MPLNKLDKSYLTVHSSTKNSFGFRGKIRINRFLFCPTSSSHHKIKNVTSLYGPAKGTHEHAQLAKKTGFSYHQELGELIYTYVVC
jgi:hypothetical protein